jgi:hypothetical protein
MQGIGRADVLLYFKRPTTQQMRYPVNAYKKTFSVGPNKPSARWATQTVPGTLDFRPKYQMAGGKSTRAATLQAFSVDLCLEPGDRI